MNPLELLVAALLVAASVGTAGLGLASTGSAPESEPTVIKIVEHAGYFETQGSIFDVEPGPYVFVVENRSGKDAGFVVSREGREPLAIGIEDGKTGRLEANLDSGEFSYYCPIIPTPKYPLTVR